MTELPRPSAVPAVLDALVLAFSAIPNVSVYDGPVRSWPQSDVIAVGISDASVEVSQAMTGRLGIAYDESLEIVCTLYSWTGDAAIKPRRDRCSELLTAIRTVLDADKTLGEACDTAVMGPRLVWTQAQSAKGASCAVGFSIETRTTI